MTTLTFIVRSQRHSRVALDGAVALALAVLFGATGCTSAVPNVTRPPALVAADGRAPAKLQAKLEREAFKAKHVPDPQMWPEEAQNFFAQKRVPTGRTGIPVERYQDALEHMKRMPQHSIRQGAHLPPQGATGVAPLTASLDPTATTASLGGWTPLGPGNIGGRTRALLIDPTLPSTMYAGGVAGGVWKTTDSGSTWFPVSDQMANLAVSSMAMDPQNPDIVYAGTGEGYFNGDAVRGAGIFLTTDAGGTWSRLSSTNTSDFYYVNKLVVSPNNSSRLYAATRTGIWRSSNGGSTWTRMLDGSAVNGCLDLAIRTDQSADYMFAACGAFAQGTVYRNTDAGGSGSWTSVLGNVGASPDTKMGRTSLAIAPSDQSVVYALTASIDLSSNKYNHGLNAVYRSTSAGDLNSWTRRVDNTNATKLNTVLLTNPVFAFYNQCFGGLDQYFNQGWYDNVIAVDPTDSNRVWVGGIDLFRSDDGGANWGISSYWWASSTAAHYAHADQHAIVFHPQYDGTSNKQMFVGDDGGLFRTDDARAATTTDPCYTGSGSVSWTTLNNKYGVTQFYHGVPDPAGTTYFGGTQDNGTIRGTDSGGITGWSSILGGDGGYVAVDSGNTSVLFAENTRLSIQKSTNGGAQWSSATNGINENSGNFLFIAPFTMDPSTSGPGLTLWTGGHYIWRTTNSATTWTQASAITPGNGSVSAVGVAKSNRNAVLVGMSDGYILMTTSGLSTNSSTNWSDTRPASGYVSWLAFDPTNANIAYATYATFGRTHVWKSTNGGASWAGIDGSGSTGIPDVPAHSIVVDPGNPSILYVGTDVGVFISTDGGSTWAVETTGFANVITEALAIGSVGGTQNLFAFTHGRGVWRVPTAGGTEPNISASPLDLPFPSTPTGGESATKDITVTNTGAGLLTVSSVTVGGTNADQFRKVSETCTTAQTSGQSGLGGGHSCTVRMSFKPTTTGSKTGRVAIASNDRDAGIVTSTLRGTATQPPTFTLTVSKSGSGSGTVTSTDNAINCGSTCSATYTSGASAVLNASAAAGSAFTGWSGGCTGTGSCTVTMNADTTVIASFVPAVTLTVNKGGSGTGSVSSNPPGINCGNTCSASYSTGASVTLTATADSDPTNNSSFKSWSGGGCSGSGTCTVTMNANQSVTAAFSKTLTDDPLTANSTEVKALHITELRTAINNLRTSNGLAAFTFTDATLTAGSTQIKAVHVNELRSALNDVYDKKNMTPPTYADPTLTAGQTQIKKAHIEEIRGNVKSVE